MGVQQLMILVMVLFFSPASSAPLSKDLVSENTHGNMRDKGIDEDNSIVGGNSGMVNHSKYATVLRGGAGGGRPGGDGEQSNSPQGGNGAVPVYAAGAAAGQRRNHKGDAATCTPCWKGGFAILIATISASLLLHIPM